MSPQLRKRKDKKEPDRILIAGKPDYEQCDNKVVSARYSLLTFLPVVRKSYSEYEMNEWICSFSNTIFLILSVFYHLRLLQFFVLVWLLT